MGHEDRERKFEQALARHLRVRDGAGARNKTDGRAAVPDETAGPRECPDAEMLAAFHKSTLSNEEMNATKEHVAGCARCQQILLLLETTDEIPLTVEAEEDLNIPEAVVFRSSGNVDDAPTFRSNSTIAGQVKPASRAPQDISRARGFNTLRWVAPAGAIAAGLLIWVVVRDKLPTLNPVNSVQVAQEQSRDERSTAPQPLPAAPVARPTTKGRQLTEPRKDNGRSKQQAEESGAVLRAPNGSSTDSITNRAELEAGDRTSDANASPVARESGDYASRGAARDKAPVASARGADVAASATAPASAPEPTDNSLAQSAGPAGQTDQKAAKQSANANQTVVDHTDGNGDVPLIPTERMVTNDQLELHALKRVGAENAKIILAPTEKVRWRLLPAGKIERSSNGGVTWAPQDSGVNVELIGGSAPSNAVCWIFGRGGTILKTTDGGGHWIKVAWPDPGEIVGIQGLDALNAIAYEGGFGLAARLATNDGGVTWFRTNK